MKRIPPSKRIEQAISEFLRAGLEGEPDPAHQLLMLGAQRLIQEAVEQEATDFLGRGHYERRPADAPMQGYRNGYEPAHVRTAEGEIEVSVPQTRDSPTPYRSTLMEFLRCNTDVLERLAVDMYARGLSTRDIEDAFKEATGECLLSKSAVSELTDVLWKEYEAFSHRDLSKIEVVYLYLDAVYESLRRYGGVHEGILCCWAICADGRKVMIHLALGNKERYEDWQAFLRDVVGRGLREPVLIVSDGAPGLIQAIDEMWPRSLRQRCLVHKARNILNKVPEFAKAEIRQAIQGAYYAPSPGLAQQIADEVLAKYKRDYPTAMKCFAEDFEACIAYLRCPSAHHKHIRSTNLLERSFLEERRRTKVIPHFFNERSCLKLVYISLIQASRRWSRVAMTEIESRQLQQLRAELGLPPTQTDERDELSTAA